MVVEISRRMRACMCACVCASIPSCAMSFCLTFLLDFFPFFLFFSRALCTDPVFSVPLSTSFPWSSACLPSRSELMMFERRLCFPSHCRCQQLVSKYDIGSDGEGIRYHDIHAEELDPSVLNLFGRGWDIPEEERKKRKTNRERECETVG